MPAAVEDPVSPSCRPLPDGQARKALTSTSSRRHDRQDSAFETSHNTAAAAAVASQDHPVHCLWDPNARWPARMLRRIRVQYYRYNATWGFIAFSPWENAIGNAILVAVAGVVVWRTAATAAMLLRAARAVFAH